MHKPWHGLAAAICGLVCGVACSAAGAAPVTFRFSGTVTSDPFGLSSFGAPIVGEDTLDSVVNRPPHFSPTRMSGPARKGCPNLQGGSERPFVPAHTEDD